MRNAQHRATFPRAEVIPRKVVDQKRGVALPPTTHKHCPRCGGFLPLEDFRPNARLKSGWSSWCRRCSLSATREWRDRNREAIDAYNRARRIPPAELTCVECGVTFEGRRNRLVCSRGCKDARYAKFHPEQAQEKARRHQRRVRAKRKAAK